MLVRNVFGMGDCLNIFPLVRKFYSMTSRLNENLVVYVQTEVFDLFKKIPYAVVADLNDYNNDEDEDVFTIEYRISPDNHYIFRKTRQISALTVGNFHLIDFFSFQCGFTLTPEEKFLEYFPDPLYQIGFLDRQYNLPEKYVVISPNVNAPNRTLSRSSWQNIIDFLYENGIYTVVVGSGIPYSDEIIDFKSISKGYYSDLRLEYGLDLCNKSSLDETWEIISNSFFTIVLDMGLLHLAGTTDTNIVFIPSNIHPSFRSPFRNGSQDYKLSLVSGAKCDIYCHSNIVYNKIKGGGFKNTPPFSVCPEGYEQFYCIPTSEMILDKISQLI